VMEVSMRTKVYLMVTSAVFFLVAVLHAIRLCYQVPVHIGSVDIPVWFSWTGTFVAAALSLWGFIAGRRYRHY
jgi:hypothetical protein